MSLPMLNKVAKDRREAGLKTFAIDLQEPKETVQPVAAKLIPDVPVLLDERGETSPLYKITGIPQTVVVGKDGKVRKVFIGAGPDHEAKMRAAVDAALKE
jgi:peroxiredoxin